MKMKAAGIWENWGKTQVAALEAILSPHDQAGLERIILHARETRKCIKVVGAGHSFSGIARPQDIAIKMDAFRGIIAVDTETRQVTFGAGTYLHEIPGLLAPYGLAMQNLGDIDRQTLAGAISTGTHGTGITFGGLATQIRGITLIDGQGNCRRITADNPELSAVALNLGALGVIIEIILQCVPSFVLHAVEAAKSLEEILEGFHEIVSVADHFEFFWFPRTSKAITKTLTRLPGDALRQPVPQYRKVIEDHYISNGVFRIMCEVNHFFPRVSNKLSAAASAAMGNREYSDYSAKVLISQREVKFCESEWAVPVENLIPAFQELSRRINSSAWPVIFPVEVRTAAADQLMLSTATGRMSGYIAVHEYYRDNSAGYFAECEEILLNYGGRPHWGKMHTQTTDFFRTAYPQFADFLELRNAYDPERIFTNAYLTAVLGE